MTDSDPSLYPQRSNLSFRTTVCAQLCHWWVSDEFVVQLVRFDKVLVQVHVVSRYICRRNAGDVVDEDLVDLEDDSGWVEW